MILREAKIKDVPQIKQVRNSVTENTLSNPDIVTDELCIEYITQRGKGWVCEIEGAIVGFSIVDLKENNIWALFMHPNFAKRGIGRQLLDIMLDWYFEQTKDKVWLGTDPGTRAEQFYRKSGWQEVGVRENGEIKFEMTYEDWTNSRNN